MDDYLDSVDKIEEGKKLITQVAKIRKVGGFETRSWTCNLQEVLK